MATPGITEKHSDAPRSAHLLVGLLVLLLSAGLSLSEAWRHVELKGYDQLLRSNAPMRSSLPITLIGIDEASFQQIGKQWPWPRRMHAELIQQLNKAGALVVGIDLLMSEASPDQEDDRLLAEAIATAGNVVMVADMAYQESQYARQWLRVDPLEAFRKAGSGVGLANVTLDSDLVVRRIPEGDDVMWREIIRKANQTQPGLLQEPSDLKGRLIGYAGPDHTFPTVSYYQALRADTDLPAGVFQNQIVLIGRDVKASPDAGAAQADTFATPFTAATGWLTPGVELHANILESALTGSSIEELPWPWTFALILAASMLSIWSMRTWRPLRSGLTGIAAIGFIGMLSWGLFTRYQLWLPTLAAMLTVVLCYVGLGAIAFFSEQRQRQETRRAFSMYLAPEVVDQIMAHPEKLKLGGERREVTLLFTDLAGFTTLSEMLGPEQVAQLLNEHFTRATTIIKQYGGTVNRFIGDAIMAFWGAPLDDPEQALHACRAGIEIQLDMRELREELAARGLPPLHMRVGIHSGPAILGNLGSSDRFDYTAIGDAVNLAARLEGVNKLYGTEILVSADTAGRLKGALPLRRVDRVIVKGKTEAVDIFTLQGDATINTITDQAFDAYANSEWATSRAAWEQILALAQDDSIALLYLERIAAFERQPPAPAWGGALALEKL